MTEGTEITDFKNGASKETKRTKILQQVIGGSSDGSCGVYPQPWRFAVRASLGCRPHFSSRSVGREP